MVDSMTSHRQTKQVRNYIQLMQTVRANGGAECEQVPEIFYPEDIPFLTERRQAEKLAQTICNRCPLIDACADFAINTNELYGIWGGLTTAQRIKTKRK
jgi:WhiB family redox-sensing transcriptional regulator